MTTELERKFALSFARGKGRMPENELELVEWLLEFDAELGNALSMILDNYENHMLLCRGALELPKGRVS